MAPLKNYFRLMLGKKSTHAEDCLAGGFVGADFDIKQDLTNKLPEEWREFNKEFIPIFLAGHPDKTKVTAGLACGALWTIAKYIKIGDILLCPDGTGTGRYRVAQVSGNYYYEPAGFLPHRRQVQWLSCAIAREEISEALQNSTGSIGTICDITKYGEELEKLLNGATSPTLVSTDETVEDPSAFAMEKHLEDFLVQNWSQTELAKDFDIYEEDGERVGQQYPTDTGPIDILAISRDTT